MIEASEEYTVTFRVDVSCFERHPLSERPVNQIRAFRIVQQLQEIFPNVTAMVKTARQLLEVASFKIYRVQTTKDVLIFSWNLSTQEYLNRRETFKKQLNHVTQKVIEMIPTGEENGVPTYASEG